MCGVLEDLVSLLGNFSPRLVTYAGGASSLKDLDRVTRIYGVCSAVDCVQLFRLCWSSPLPPTFDVRTDVEVPVKWQLAVIWYHVPHLWTAPHLNAIRLLEIAFFRRSTWPWVQYEP